MQRTPVSSSNICAVGYDIDSAVLEVEFDSGDVYQYYGVPQYLYEQFRASSSLGSFLHEHIRPSYRYQKQ
jgi:hypothetical protein